MAHGADITVVALNTGISDTQAAALVAGVDITHIEDSGDLDIITDTTTSGAGAITRAVHVHFLAPYLAKFPTDPEQDNALIGLIQSIIGLNTPHPQVTHTVTLVP